MRDDAMCEVLGRGYACEKRGIKYVLSVDFRFLFGNGFNMCVFAMIYVLSQ